MNMNLNLNNTWSGGWSGSDLTTVGPNQPIWIDHTKTIMDDTITVTTSGEQIWTISQNVLSEDEIQFFELVLSALGVNIKYDDFKNMNESQRKNLLREVKINIITK